MKNPSRDGIPITLDTEYVIDEVTERLAKKPSTLTDLYAHFDFKVSSVQLNEALDILEALSVLTWRQVPSMGTLLPVYEITDKAKLPKA